MNWLPEIQVAQNGWNDLAPRDIERILSSSANELLKNLPIQKLPKIVVYPRGSVIRVPNELNREGETIVQLPSNNDELRWVFYAEDFAYELCQVLCQNGQKVPSKHQWFLKTLCVAASLYVIPEISRTWSQNPPFEDTQWRRYATQLGVYGQREITSILKLPAGDLLALAKDKGQPEFAAAEIVRILQRNPKYWNAILYLDKDTQNEDQTFSKYLGAWYKNTPPEYQPFIGRIADLLGVTISKHADDSGPRLDLSLLIQAKGDKCRYSARPPMSLCADSIW